MNGAALSPGLFRRRLVRSPGVPAPTVNSGDLGPMAIDLVARAAEQFWSADRPDKSGGTDVDRARRGQEQ